MKAGKPYLTQTDGQEAQISPTEARRRQRALGRRLRQMYDEVALEPVPDDFMALLDEIDQKAAVGDKPDEDAQ